MIHLSVNRAGFTVEPRRFTLTTEIIPTTFVQLIGQPVPLLIAQVVVEGWNLEIWKRLGVEYHYYDHAYIQVKNAQGNWAQIYSSSGPLMTIHSNV